MARTQRLVCAAVIGALLLAHASHAADMIRPSAVVLDPRAYVSPFFLTNTAEAMDQLRTFYSYVPQWWSVWGNPVPLNFVMPSYFGDVFRYPYTDANNNTRPFGYYIIDEMRALAGALLSITVSQATDVLIASSQNVDLCRYAVQNGITCNLRVEAANISYPPGTFYERGYQYFHGTLVNTSVIMTRQLNATSFRGFVIHELNSLAEMKVTPGVSFANAVQNVNVWISDSSLIQYYGMNATQAVFQFTNSLFNLARLKVTTIQIDATTLVTAAPQNLQNFINYAATQKVQVELYLSNIQWGLTTYNGYLNAYTTLGNAVAFIYAGNQTYPPSSPDLIPTMPPTPTTAVPTFPPSLAPSDVPSGQPSGFPSNRPTSSGGNNGGGNGGGNTSRAAASAMPWGALAVALAGAAAAVLAMASV